jgi:hypothetical protein
MSRARDTADQINRVNSSAADATAITVDSSENVGIGTSSPTTKLSVSGGYISQTNAGVSTYLGEDGAGGSLLGTTTNNYFRFITNDTERMRIDSAGKVGIGDSSPSARLEIGGMAAGEQALLIQSGRNDALSNGLARINITDSVCPFAGLQIDHAGTGAAIIANGNVLVGKNVVGVANVGAEFRKGVSDYAVTGVSSSNAPALFGRNVDDGDIIRLRKDNAAVGSIGTSSGVTYYAHTNGDGFALSNNYIFPSRYGGARDNQIDLGISWARWDDIWATNGTIQTSDFNEKQDIASLTATEMLVGKRISALFKTFRWKDSVAEKGDNARTHTGVIAQDVQAAFTAEGLDAGDYALFISDTWWTHDVDVPAVEAVAEVTDEDGNVTTEAVEAVAAYTRTDTYEIEDEAPEGATSKTRLGIRYPELLSFVAAYNEQRFASIEARLTALEA